MKEIEHEAFMRQEYPQRYLDDGSLNLSPAHFPLHSSLIINNHCKRLGLKFEDIFKLNSQGLRCDEFTKSHEGKTHILFAGCSYTFGDGLPLEHIWAYKTYNHLSSMLGDTSGYFNVATPSASILSISLQILKYTSMYGYPDMLLVMMPDSDREMLNDVDPQRMQGLASQMYGLMSRLLKDNGCKVITMSWDAIANKHDTPGKRIKEFDPRTRMVDDFFQFIPNDRDLYVYEMDKRNNSFLGSYEEFVVTAMDNHHPGIAEHDFYYNFVADIIDGKVTSSVPFTAYEV